MATVSRGKTFGPTENVTADKLHQLVDDAQVTNITDADVAQQNKDGGDNVPSLRTLGSGSSQAAKGSHVHGQAGYSQVDTDGIADGAITAAKLLPALVLPTGNGGTGVATYSEGDILVGNSSDGLSVIPVGDNGQVLMVDSTSPVGLSWQNPPPAIGPTVVALSAPYAMHGNLGTPSVPGLSFDVAPGESWVWEARLLIGLQAHGATTFTIKFTGPATTVCRYQIAGALDSANHFNQLVNTASFVSGGFATIIIVGFMTRTAAITGTNTIQLCCGVVVDIADANVLAGSSITAWKK
jgi:hypothetical protein